MAKMKGDSVDAGGLILSGSNSQRPFFAYGKVVKLRHGGYRYEWYPKCKLTENSDDISTSEDKTSEQTDTILRVLHADGDETLYAHMQYLFVKAGECVTAGQILGTVGETGNATGPHLHFEILHRGLRYDPAEALQNAS